MSRHASRLLAIARWLTPSLVAACAAALVGGVIEGWGSSPAAFVATAGFVAIAAVPSITVLSIAIRALWAGWDPPTLLDVLIEPTGGAPGLAAWFSFLLLGGAAFGAIILRATWALGTRTSFAPLGIGFLEPLIFVSAGLVLFALSRPSVRGITALARVIDRRWPLRPRRIIVGVAIVVLVVGLVAWFLVDSWLGPIDGRPLVVLALAALAALASHAMSLRAFPIWRWCSLAIVVIAILAVGTAGFALRARPGLTLSIWGNRPIAGLVIDHVFDLDAVRDEVSTNNFRPVARPDAKHPDIVLITIDTVRSDQTPPYGGPADMPYLKEMASRGTVFEWAFSPSNVTRRSIPSMVIGLQPNRVHGRVVGWALRVDPRHTLVAERLRAGGYDTAGFMCCEGFWGVPPGPGSRADSIISRSSATARSLASLAKAWIQAREQLPDRKPLFLWMHILEPHNWHENRSDPSDPVARRKLYNESLAASDRMVAEPRVGISRSATDPDRHRRSRRGARRSRAAEPLDRPLRLSDPRPVRDRGPGRRDRAHRRDRQPQRSHADAGGASPASNRRTVPTSMGDRSPTWSPGVGHRIPTGELPSPRWCAIVRTRAVSRRWSPVAGS